MMHRGHGHAILEARKSASAEPGKRTGVPSEQDRASQPAGAMWMEGQGLCEMWASE